MTRNIFFTNDMLHKSISYTVCLLCIFLCMTFPKKILANSLIRDAEIENTLQMIAMPVFTAAKMPVSEGYGLTETSPVISVNLAHSKKPCYGTVGEVIKGVKVKINHEEGMREGEGEILVQGPNVMRGYYKKEEETKKVIDKGKEKNTINMIMIMEDILLIIQQ